MEHKEKRFEDKEIRCKNCRVLCGIARIDRQVLVIGELAFFNFCRFACLRCEAINSWEASNLLPDEIEKSKDLNRRYPDRLRDVEKPPKRIVNQLGVKGVSRQRNGTYKARITQNGETRYLGIFSTIEQAERACQKAREGNLVKKY